MSGDADTSVQVALRIRPQSASEKIEMCRVCTNVTPDHPQVILGKDKAFTYDLVFDITSKQFEVYRDCIEGLIEGCFEGYNATVLAYGQTGAGKTYTMGTGFDVNISKDEEGIIPRAVSHLFDGIEKRKLAAKENGEPPPDFKVNVQFMELYNEELIDLFDSESRGSGKHIKIHEDTNGGIYTVGVTMKQVNSAKETLNNLQQGALSRTTASTNMNAQSSRSHAIFTLHITQQRVVKLNNDETVSNGVQGKGFEYEMLTAKFNFVDLAGSERLKRTGATGDRAKEGISINCGLLALGNVISALGDKAKRGTHVPYRDSKLTRLLQDSLGGNSRTLMIACVSPSDRDFMETLNTLKYANRARNIKNKVVVNQDKASKQIATLRAEIQALTMQLNEFKQGKRVAGEGEAHMSDMYHENTMLQAENDKLRMRIKALNLTVDGQKKRITEYMANKSIAMLNGELKGGVEELISGYIEEIEELRSRLLESEAMASAVARRSVTTPSRMGRASIDAPAESILEIAKQDLNSQMKKAKELQSMVVEDKKPEVLDLGSDGEKESGDESQSEEEEENEEENEKIGSSSNESEDGDEEAERDEREENKDTEILREDLAGLSTEISIKQQLIEELENSQKRLNNMKLHYEEKLSLLERKIKETETERDRVLETIHEHDKEAAQQSQKVKSEYEKKINDFKDELKKLQSAKREHNRLMRTKTQNEMQLKGLTRDLDELKKTKVKLMRQMKEEIAKNKQREAERDRQISQLKKENRKREIQFKNMESEKRQKELVLKRKQAEVKQLRQQQKPISGKLGKQRKLNPVPAVPDLSLSSTASMVVSGTGVEVQPVERSERANGLARNVRGLNNSKTTRVIGKVALSPRKRLSSSQVKKTWETIEKQIERIVAHNQTVCTMESDMDRWIKDRDMLSKKIENCNKKLEEAKSGNDDNTTRDLNEQLDAFKAHLDYVQDNITEAQTEIADLEDGGETTEITEVITSCSTHEARLLMEHFLNKTIQLSKETVSKDATVKELETKLEALRQHSELQQDLVMNLLRHPGKDDPSIPNKNPKDPEEAVNGVPELRNGITDDIVPFMSKSEFMALIKDDVQLNTTKGSQTAVKEKARRRSSTQKELLYPARLEKRESTLSSIPDVPEEPTLPPTNKEATLNDPIDTTDLKQKLLQLERARKAMEKIDSTQLPPPPAKVPVPIANIPLDRDRPQSVAGSTSNSFVRGSFKSKSARNFARPKAPLSSSVNVTSSAESRSQPTSPTPQRKSLEEKGKLGNGQNDADDVFSRLTSTLTQESNPNAGRMLPVKPPTGRPGSLVCVYASTGHNSAVLSLCVSETTMFTGSKDRTVKIWDLNTGEETMSLGQHKRDVTSLKYCIETKRLFSVSQNIIKIWDIRSPPSKCIKSITSGGVTSDSAINDLTVNHPGTHVFAATGNTVKIWDLNNYQMIGKLGGHAGHVMALLLLGNQEPYLMLTGSRDHYIKLFELTGSLSGIQKTFSPRPKSPFKKLTRKSDLLKTPIQTFEPPHYDGVQSLALNGNNLFSGSRDNTIKKWNFSTQQVQQNLISAHKDWVCSLDFLRSHNVLVSGCRGGVLKLWEPETCQEIGEIKAHRHPINAIATNSSFVFTASSDRLIRVWKSTEILDEQLSQISQNRS
ncbi:kinesin-like protein KIF21A isoform X2 [Dendronephthya gigantea]|uniref:kinesin-like protein KIF21A isoform X2 n=1 Tax=Dendronephthya gigantea TaxID=151771 RepID=UPI00106A47F5|nr:kinesin-like protein KIF21A isoform X2 [Dendronephthya gigantea]